MIPNPNPKPSVPRPVSNPPRPATSLPMTWPDHVRRNVEAALLRLDRDQRHASDVVRFSGSRRMVVSATAGSGKTTFLVTTMAALMVLDGVDPADLLMLTFTAKAGAEMRERLGRLLGQVPRDLNVGTFHAIAGRRLRTLGRTTGLTWPEDRNLDTARFDSAIPTASDIWESIIGWRREGVLGTNEPSLDLGKAERGAKKRTLDPLVYASRVELLRADALDPESEEARVAAERLEDEADGACPGLWVAWQCYNRAKEALRVWDYADLLDAWHLAVESGAETWRPGLVAIDEAQDNNRRQLLLGRALAGDHQELLVGDGAQSIYGFRGARPDIFVEASKAADAVLVTLPNNYRSDPAIVDAANRISATLGSWTGGLVARAARTTSETMPLGVIVGSDPLDTAYRVATSIRLDQARSGRRLGDYAILVRTNNAAASYEGAFMVAGLPSVRWGGAPFWEHRDVLAFVGYGLLAAGPAPGPGLLSDVDLVASGGAFRRVVHTPKRFLSRAWIDRVATAVLRGETLQTAIRQEKGDLKGRSREGALELADFIDRIRRHSWRHTVGLIRELMTNAVPAGDATPDDDRKGIPATVARIALTEHYNGRPLANGLELALYADMASKNAEAAKGELPDDKVVISTIHKMKGLERPVVYVGIEDGVFPSPRSETVAEIQEERRLAYVAFTRARDRLVWVASSSGVDGKTANLPPFLEMLPEPQREAMREYMRTVMPAQEEYPEDLPA